MAIPVLADAMGMASIIQRRQDGADEVGEGSGQSRRISTAGLRLFLAGGETVKSETKLQRKKMKMRDKFNLRCLGLRVLT